MIVIRSYTILAGPVTFPGLVIVSGISSLFLVLHACVGLPQYTRLVRNTIPLNDVIFKACLADMSDCHWSYRAFL